MRSYNVAIASLAIEAPQKWTDNLLSHHVLPGVVSGTRGLARRIPYQALVRLALVRQLHTVLGIGVADAVRIAGVMLDSAGTPIYSGGQLSVTLDRAALERRLDARLADVLESAPTPRRGRPHPRS